MHDIDYYRQRFILEAGLTRFILEQLRPARGEIDRCSGEQGNGHHISQQGEWSDRADRWCFANF